MKKDILNLSSLFLDERGVPIILTNGQRDIFQTILNRNPKRNIVVCATQYGKSLTVALGIIIRAIVKPEKWAIVAPSERKAQIVMNYVIQHIFDNPLFLSQLDVDIPLDRLRRERSKQRLTFRRGGEVFVLSADARNKKKTGEALMGFGAANVVLDESALIDDELYATVKRMLGGHKDNFLLEIGNPWKRNHFLKAWHSDNYHRILIDYHQAIQEGRFSREFIEEMEKEAFFKVLYECKFPEAGEIDESGWTPLLIDKQIEEVINKIVESQGRKRLGVDVARGGNYNVLVLRYDNYAKVLEKNRDPDLMSTVGKVKRFIEDEGIEARDVFIDDVGVGGGVVDRLKEQNIRVNAVKEGGKARDDKKFVNVKAEAYWELRKWVLDNGSLERNEDFYQLTEIKYKEDSSSRLKIESKEEMLKRGIESPDVADALMLTFTGLESKFTGPIKINKAGFFRR
ncbi:terminase family protein [Patescibacteria group bacterium]|nr:terminase family protein [Patescibacteria group bacterium]